MGLSHLRLREPVGMVVDYQWYSELELWAVCGGDDRLLGALLAKLESVTVLDRKVWKVPRRTWMEIEGYVLFDFLARRS
jgi:hypothetical protein